MCTRPFLSLSFSLPILTFFFSNHVHLGICLNRSCSGGRTCPLPDTWRWKRGRVGARKGATMCQTRRFVGSCNADFLADLEGATVGIPPTPRRRRVLTLLSRRLCCRRRRVLTLLRHRGVRHACGGYVLRCHAGRICRSNRVLRELNATPGETGRWRGCVYCVRRDVAMNRATGGADLHVKWPLNSPSATSLDW